MFTSRMTEPTNLHERQPWRNQPLGDRIQWWKVRWLLRVGKSVRCGQSGYFSIPQRVVAGLAHLESRDWLKVACLDQHSPAIACDGPQVIAEPDAFTNIAIITQFVVGKLFVKSNVGLRAIWLATSCGSRTRLYKTLNNWVHYWKTSLSYPDLPWLLGTDTWEDSFRAERVGTIPVRYRKI